MPAPGGRGKEKRPQQLFFPWCVVHEIAALGSQ
jgi:hypothetical protein